MVPANASVDLERVFLFIVEVEPRHLRGIETITSTAKASATSTEAYVVDIVCVAHAEDLQVAAHVSSEGAAAVAVFCTHACIDVGHEAFVHARFDAEVEHGLLIPVVDTGDTGQVALLVISLHLINNGSRDVLHGRLRVSGHELFAVDKNLLYLFAVDRDLSVIVDLGTGQSLDELLDGGAFGGAVSAGVVDEGVFFQYDLLRLCRHRSFFEHDGISGKEDGAQLYVGILLNGYRPCESLIADAGNLQDELSVGRRFDRELTVIAGGGSRDEGRVVLQQLHRSE